MIQFQPAGLPQEPPPQPAPAPSLEEIQARRKLAEEMMKEGTSYAPVQHWTQGLARVAQALSGNWQLNQANKQSGELQGDANKTLLDLYKPSVTGQGMPAVPKPQPPPQQAPPSMTAPPPSPMTDDQQGVAKFAQPGLAQALPGRLAAALDPSLAQTGAGSGAASGSGTVDRSQFKNDLQNPEIRNRLIALTHAEVGNQGPEAKQAFLESVVNRAAARNQPLSSAINDPSYFPKITQQRAARGVPSDLASGYQPLVDAMAGGSNTAKYATGNASGTVGFNGGPQTAAYGGERFGIEGPDRAWAQRQGQGQPPSESPVRTIWQAPQQPTQVADSSQGKGMTRDTLARMLANPYTRDAAQKLILEQQKPKNENEYGLNPVFGQDANGNAIILQLGKHGNLNQPALPKGVSISRNPIKIDTGTGTVLIDPITRQPVQNIAKDTAGVASAKEQGEAQGKAVVNLPLAENAAQRMLDQIDKLIEEPGLEQVTGSLYGRLPAITNVSDGAKTAQSRIDKILGGTFLQAYNDLRGAGAISNAEGQTAKAAYSRLQNQELGTPQYRDAVVEFKNEVLKLREIARSRARGGPQGQPQQSAPKIHDLGDGFTMEVH